MRRGGPVGQGAAPSSWSQDQVKICDVVTFKDDIELVMRRFEVSVCRTSLLGLVLWCAGSSFKKTHQMLITGDAC
jgi:hypothetical protein